MDQQLKQRLIGLTIAVALIVIFVPMLFEKSDDKGKFSTAGIPAIPEDVLEKPLELPKTAEDLAPKEKEKDADKAPVESGYRIVPLIDEAPPKPAKPKIPAPVAAKPVPDDESGEPAETAASVEEDKAETASPAKKTAPETHRPEEAAKQTPAKSPKAAPPVAAVKPLAEPKPTAKKAKPTPAEEPKAPNVDEEDVSVPAPAAPVKTASPPAKPKPKPVPSLRAQTAEPTANKASAVKKPDAAKPGEPHRTPIKTVKVNKPKPAAAPQETDEEDEGVPAPAKAETPPKPKPAAAKNSEPAKPADAHAPTAKTEKPHPAHALQAKPATAKPAPPAKAKEAGAAKAAPKKPSTWVVQAGSFTDESAARSLAEKLKQSKFAASVHPAHGANGTVYRVQVGTEHDRSHAEETLKQIEGSTGINGLITSHH